MPSFSGAAKGAAVGAGIGSIVPGFGTAIGAGVGGLIGLFKGGGKKKPEPEDELQGILDTLKDSSAGKQGAALSGAGIDQLQPVLDYFKKLSSGDPSAVLEATKPERGRVIDQYDTARNAISNFGPRGGGSNAAVSSSYTSEANQLSDITSNARQSAIATSAQLGTTLAGLGLSAEQLKSADLNTVVQAILANKGLGLQQRGQNMEALSGIGEAIGTILASRYGGA